MFQQMGFAAVVCYTGFGSFSSWMPVFFAAFCALKQLQLMDVAILRTSLFVQLKRMSAKPGTFVSSGICDWFSELQLSPSIQMDLLLIGFIGVCCH
jgi:hypothetical protein